MDLTDGDILGCSEIRAARESECFGQRMPFFCRDVSDLGSLTNLCQWWHKRCVRNHAIGATEVHSFIKSIKSIWSHNHPFAFFKSIFPKDAASHVDKVRMHDLCAHMFL
jgi:hypothetical protein